MFACRYLCRQTSVQVSTILLRKSRAEVAYEEEVALQLLLSRALIILFLDNMTTTSIVIARVNMIIVLSCVYVMGIEIYLLLFVHT